MQEKTLEVLEFGKILEKLQTYARSELVKKEISKIKPKNNLKEIKDELEKTKAMEDVIVENGNIDILDFSI